MPRISAAYFNRLTRWFGARRPPRVAPNRRISRCHIGDKHFRGGPRLEPALTLSFEDPADFPDVITPARVRLLQGIDRRAAAILRSQPLSRATLQRSGETWHFWRVSTSFGLGRCQTQGVDPHARRAGRCFHRVVVDRLSDLTW